MNVTIIENLHFFPICLTLILIQILMKAKLPNLLTKVSFAFTLLLFLGSETAFSQTQPMVIYDPGGPIGNTIPFNSAASNRRAWIYTPQDFPNSQPGLITRIYFLASGNPSPSFTNVTISMGTTTLSNFTGNVAWPTGGTVVLNAPTYTPVGTPSTGTSSGTWMAFDLTTPFLFDNVSNFFVDAQQNGYTTGFTTQQANVPGKSVFGSASAAAPGIQDRHAMFGFDWIPAGPCTAPPVAGATIANPQTVCIGNTTNLTVDPMSFGQGQTYQWQSSTNGTTWVNMLNDTLSAVNATVNDTTFYRLAITCNNQTSFSTPVRVDAVGSSLSGAYTINQFGSTTGTNFASFQDFFDALVCGGVTGPVTVDVVSGTGPYLERVEAGPIAGTSAVNTITINGNGNTLSYAAAGTNDRTTFVLDGTSHLHVDSLNIFATGTTYGWVMQLMNGADHNTFTNCHFETSTTGTSTFFSGVVMSSSLTSALTLGNNANHTTFDNCKFIGGYYGLTMNGTNTNNRNVGNAVTNCVFEDQHFYATYMRAQDSLNFSGNDISRATRTQAATYYGIFFSTGLGRSIVKNNIIHDVHNALPATNTSACYPVYMSGATGVAGSPSIFANNLIYNINNGGIFYGLYILGALNDHWKFYHNTVVMDQPSSTSTSATRPVFFSGAQNNFEMKNNIFYLNRPSATNFMVYMTSAANNVDFDNNVYYTPHPNSVTFGFSGGNLNDFSDWQGAGYDANGIETDPSFAVPGSDYHPTVGSIKALGTNVLSDVPFDLNGDPRTTSPDPGVYQFDPAPCSGAYDFVVDTLFPGGVEISWQSFGNVTEWQVEWDTCGFIPGSGLGNLDSVVTSNNNHAIAMPMGQCFCIFVREKCPSGGYGVWTGPIEVCVPIEYDAQLLSLASPEYFDCGDSLMEVKVEIRNNGFFPITSLPITVEITGDINQTFTTTYTGNLQETEVDTVTMGTINSYWGGYINVVASVSLPNDQFTGNDTLTVDSLAILPFQPNVLNNEYCIGDDSVTLSLLPFPNIMFNWFDAPTGGNMVHIGDELTVGTAAPPTFYVAFNDLMDSLESTATGNVSTSNGGNMFDLVIFNTLSVTGFSLVGASSGFTDVQVYYKLGSLQGHETNPASWTLHETVPNVNLQGTANFVRFNLTNPIPMTAGQTYGVYIQPVTGNLSYASGDPLGSSLGSNADLEILTGITKAGSWPSTLSPRSWKGRVHYGSESCSDIRTPVTAVPNTDSVVANFTWTTISHTVAFQNTSANADSVVWDFAGLGTASGDSVTFQFPQTDSFEVCLIAYSSCGIDTVCQMVWAENISVERFGELLDLRLFPNPNNGTFTVSFLQHLKGDLQVEVIDLSGRVILNQLYTNHQGAFDNTYDLNHLASGMYQLRLHSPDGTAIRSFVISK
jgi:hypothetical protein